MISEFHFLRPWWFITFIPLAYFAWILWQKTTPAQTWMRVCDEHLLSHLLQTQHSNKRRITLASLFLSAAFILIALAGPTWSRLPVPTYKFLIPRILILDMSENMRSTDVSPDRLSRAKFKLHDLFKKKGAGQFGLVVYSGEPFIVSPLTDDAQTIDALLHALTPDVMPVGGHQLGTALKEAAKLINQAGFQEGDILVLTGQSPAPGAIAAARSLAQEGMHTSVMPIRAPTSSLNESFKALATAGQGMLLPFSDASDDIARWLQETESRRRFGTDLQTDVPIWKDMGRWFVIPALILLLPVFQRGWLQRVSG